MPVNKTLLNTKPWCLLGLTWLLIIVVCAAFTFTGNTNFDAARHEILFRKIGHEILLHSGDSTSRVLPVKKIAENEYQIRFENEFTFQTDSLVKIINSALAKDNLAGSYIVNVLNCIGKDVVYGYAISMIKKDNVVPCSGRKQPKGCYLIDLQFQHNAFTAWQKGWLAGGLAFIVFSGLLMAMPRKKSSAPAPAPATADEPLIIGHTLFDFKKRTLVFAGIITELTAKENKLLLIFAKSPNEIIERGRIQKEIWEDEGVIVGRSLDVFISKLRKKLESDASVRLTNIHGKGYKLEVGE